MASYCHNPSLQSQATSLYSSICAYSLCIHCLDDRTFRELPPLAATNSQPTLPHHNGQDAPIKQHPLPPPPLPRLLHPPNRLRHPSRDRRPTHLLNSKPQSFTMLSPAQVTSMSTPSPVKSLQGRQRYINIAKLVSGGRK